MKKQSCSAVLVEINRQSRTLSMHEKLRKNGYPILGVYDHIECLASTVATLKPDVLLVSVELLDASALDEFVKLQHLRPVPIIVSAKHHDPDMLCSLVSAGVNSYFLDDIEPHRLPLIIELAIERFKQLKRLSSALQEAKDKLAERKLIAKAKGIIMQQKDLSEAQAYSQMRKSAMNQGQSMAELARQIISVCELLE